jgi:purine-binding chemotaxis protein CheW
VVNLRGQILTAVHLAQKVGMRVNLPDDIQADDTQPGGDEAADRTMADPPKFNNVIMGNREEPVSLLVERIGDVMSVPVNRIEQPPAIIEGVDAKYVSKVCKLKGELLIILDSKAMEQPENSNERQA